MKRHPWPDWHPGHLEQVGSPGGGAEKKSLAGKLNLVKGGQELTSIFFAKSGQRKTTQVTKVDLNSILKFFENLEQVGSPGGGAEKKKFGRKVEPGQRRTTKGDQG